MTKFLALSLLLACPAPAAAPYQAGAARVCISPREPIWLAGYAMRTHPSTGVAADLWAKGLAVQDGRGGGGVIVTMDLLRVPVADIAQEVRRRYGLDRSQLLLNCAHNHSGPLLWEGDPFTALAPEEYAKCRRYTEGLNADLIELVGAALRNLAPASIFHGTGEAAFAANRRLPTSKGYQIAFNPDGPSDHRVPVLKVAGPDGQLRAVLFGPATFNTG